jgi:AcrR family transcriptional regulator
MLHTSCNRCLEVTVPSSSAPQLDHDLPALALRRPPGRPRDPKIDAVVRAAAADVYAECGWSGFYFDAVARRAGVGKSAIYRRWATREDLLIDAMTTVELGPMLRQQESLRAALTWLVRHQLDWWSPTARRAYMQLAADRSTHPILRKLYQDRVVTPLLDSMAEVISRAVATGEVAGWVPARLLLECLGGALNSRMNALSDDSRRQLLHDPDRYVNQLVDFVMAGAGATLR